ncbi:MAG: MBL fold metallo-hydrolase [Planctomycetia bacterium]|nr:MBL fold metallo-hydrolase [Planctomycetia bacterium]
MKLLVRRIVSQPFAENTYVVWQEGAGDALVVDPGLEPELILELLKRERLGVAAVLNTHGHADHIAGNQAMKQAYPSAPLVIGELDAAMLTDPVLNLSAAFGEPMVSPAADRTVKDGETIEYAGIVLEVRHIPGHSPGHVVYVGLGIVLGGDVLFQGSIGRYDFPGGSYAALMHGIRTKLLTLPPETVVYPGHGGATTVGSEAEDNPFLEPTIQVVASAKNQ